MTTHPCFQQKKSYLNKDIFVLLASCNSLRRISLLLKVNRKTVARKLLFLGKSCLSAIESHQHLFSLESEQRLFSHLQFDEMETIEHTKLKPLSIPLVVEARTRKILSFEVATMPAKGLLAKKSVAKYGKRRDQRAQMCLRTLRNIKPYVSEECHIMTDQNPRYPYYINEVLPGARHAKTKGARGCVTGQGELKNLEFDPLFWFNHTAAMLRANINRLVRKTWCTTKAVHGLKHHIAIYLWYHNNYLLNPQLKLKSEWQIYPELSLNLGYMR